MTGTDTTLLQTGWEPGAPANDTVTRQALLAHIARAELSARATTRRWVMGDDVAFADLGLPGLFGNHAFAIQPGRVGAAVDHANSFFPPERSFLLWCPFPTEDLTDRGLELVGHPPLMWRPTTAPVPPLPDGLRIEEVCEPEALATFERTLVDAYPLPEWAGLEPGSVFTPGLVGSGALHYWIGWVGNRPVCTAGTIVHAGVNLVEWVSTSPDARSRGFGASITFTAATADPAAPAVLLSSDAGRSVYERLGFVAVARWTLWTRPAR
jgi:hypothetical protein